MLLINEYPLEQLDPNRFDPLFYDPSLLEEKRKANELEANFYHYYGQLENLEISNEKTQELVKKIFAISKELDLLKGFDEQKKELIIQSLHKLHEKAENYLEKLNKITQKFETLKVCSPNNEDSIKNYLHDQLKEIADTLINHPFYKTLIDPKFYVATEDQAADFFGDFFTIQSQETPEFIHEYAQKIPHIVLCVREKVQQLLNQTVLVSELLEKLKENHDKIFPSSSTNS